MPGPLIPAAAAMFAVLATGVGLAWISPWLGLAVLLGALAWWQAPQNGWKAGIGVAAAAWVALGTAALAGAGVAWVNFLLDVGERL